MRILWELQNYPFPLTSHQLSILCGMETAVANNMTNQLLQAGYLSHNTSLDSYVLKKRLSEITLYDLSLLAAGVCDEIPEVEQQPKEYMKKLSMENFFITENIYGAELNYYN